MNRRFTMSLIGWACLATSSYLVSLCATGPHARAADSTTSLLWGEAGESWTPDSRLPDFSYAGYHRGERPLPVVSPETSVTEFGAVGDGTTDDTIAFQKALSEAAGKIIAIPPGRYLITDILEIRDSGTVLQGAGPDQTAIYAPIPLNEIRPNMGATTEGRPTSNYSWSGGIIWVQGQPSNNQLAQVTQAAQRGETTLRVDQADKIKVGEAVRLTLSDDEDHTLIHHLYAGDPGDFSNLNLTRRGQDWVAVVKETDVDKGTVTLDRPLRTDVRLEWKPVLFENASSVEEVGIENLAIEFPVSDYQGHFTELGHNALSLSGVRNCWVRNIEIRNADSGMFIGGSNVTLERIVWLSERQRHRTRNSTGHHGITLSGTDLLLTDFEFRTKFIHDITMTRGSAGNVVSNGRGEDLCFDHHKYANHANLFTDIDVGAGTNIFHSGGGAKLGRHCGAWTTWWNIRSERGIPFPVDWAPEMINLVGLKGIGNAATQSDGRWFELIPPEQVAPQNLYRAQLQKRLGDDSGVR